MSPKLKKWLIIGGSIFGGLVVVVIIAAVAISLLFRSGGGYAYEAYDMDDGTGYRGAYGEGEYAEEDWAYPEAPSAAPGASYDEAQSLDSSNIIYTPEDIDVSQEQQTDRLIIRNGSISLQSNDTRAAKTEIEQLVESLAGEGAFIVSSNEYGGAENLPYVSMSIRVPATQFDAVMEQITSMAVEGTNPSIVTTADDVTEEYVDLEARIETLETARDRLLALMENAATTEDLLMAERQLTEREAEIESLMGRLRYLTEAARLSRIDIDLQPYILSQPVDTRWRPAETVREAFEALIDGLRDFGDFLIFFAIAVLPWLVVFGAVIYGIIRFVIWRVRVGQRKRAAAAPVIEED
nr:DUF4349 domain-containing protein [Anaerolineae bacterium]